MARANSGADVWHQRFDSLELPQKSFDGVFANASLFHLRRVDLPLVLGQLRDCLVPGGIFFSSNPRSFDVDREGWNGERFGTYLTKATWEESARTRAI